jgi:hypothetical protein
MGHGSAITAGQGDTPAGIWSAANALSQLAAGVGFERTQSGDDAGASESRATP